MFPHLHFSLRHLPPPLSPPLSERLIKGAPPNEITPWGLIPWLIDRHTAGRGLRPSSVPSGVFFFFKLTNWNHRKGQKYTSWPVDLLFSCIGNITTPQPQGQRSNSQFQKVLKKKKKNYNSHSKAVHWKRTFHSTSDTFCWCKEAQSFMLLHSSSLSWSIHTGERDRGHCSLTRHLQ